MVKGFHTEANFAQIKVKDYLTYWSPYGKGKYFFLMVFWKNYLCNLCQCVKLIDKTIYFSRAKKGKLRFTDGKQDDYFSYYISISEYSNGRTQKMQFPVWFYLVTN